jgi:hypothetical protein
MSDRPSQNPQNNSKNFGSSNSSQNSSVSSISGATGSSANNGSNLNFFPSGQVQQQQQQRGNNNVRPVSTINRQGGTLNGVNNATNDFISFLNANSNGNSQSSNNGINSTPGTANSNALNRLETIRQYYMQLSNNLRLITQQLQSSDLTAPRRQALLMEQARANAAMQEFTEKILKPISASKQQQQQAQTQVQLQTQQQQQQQQRPPFNNQPGTTQMMQFQGRPPLSQQQQQQQHSIKSSTSSSAPTPNYIQQMSQMQQQRPPQMNSSVNLYSQSGLGMIRPIINTATPSGGNRQSTTVNFRPNSGPISVPSVPQSVPPIPNGSPQRSFRSPTAVNVPISHLNIANMNQAMQISPPTGSIPPGTPKSQQQYIFNRQTYLIAAQQHQTSVAQQQLLFQQRLSLFSRDPALTVNSPTPKKKLKRGAPILALPSVSQFNRPVSSPIRGKIQSFPVTSTISPNQFPTFNSKLTSFPSTYPIGAKLKDLAKQFKLELTEGAEEFLLRIADEFIDNLARKSILFASHRKRKLPIQPISSSMKNNKKGPILQTSESVVDEMGPELNMTVEDLMLGLDEVINYQPAGNGSIENCRPLIKRAKEANINNNNSEANTTTTTTTNHQHRLTMVKKHSSLYQNY